MQYSYLYSNVRTKNNSILVYEIVKKNSDESKLGNNKKETIKKKPTHYTTQKTIKQQSVPDLGQMRPCTS